MGSCHVCLLKKRNHILTSGITAGLAITSVVVDFLDFRKLSNFTGGLQFYAVCVCVCVYMMKFKIEERSWFSLAQERSSWRGKCRAGLEEATRKRVEEDDLKCTANAMRNAGGSGSVATTKPFHCDTCLRSFRRPQDIARHRCVTTRPRGLVMRPPT